MSATHVFLRLLFGLGISWFILLCAFSSVYAAEWTIIPTLQLGYENNDNLELTTLPHKTVNSATIAPHVDAGVQSEAWSINGAAEIARKNYWGEEGLNRTDQTFSFSSQYTDERNLYSIGASRINDSVISGTLLDPDRGLVNFQTKRNAINVNPAWTWSVTERTQLRLEYQLGQVSYVDGQSVELYDYQTRATALTLTYLLSPQDQIAVIAAYSSFRVPALNIQRQIPTQFSGVSITTVEAEESKTPIFKISGSHVFSDTLSGTLTVGARKTSTEQQVQQCDALANIFGQFVGYDCAILPPGFFINPTTSQTVHDTGTTYSGNLKKQFEKTSLNFSINRDLTASGAGTQVVGDSATLRLDRPVTDRLRGSFQVDSYTATTIVDISNTSANRRQYSLQPGLQWQWTPECVLNLGYMYTHVKRENENNIVQAHAISATLIYAWQKLSFSR